MTDVLFITQNSAYPPLGVLYLIDALRKKGIESEIITSGVSTDVLETLLVKLRPAVVGMSVMTAPEIRDFKRHSIFIKENFPTIPVIWGGVHATLMTDVCVSTNYIDHVFAGQAEELFPRLVEDLSGRPKKVPRVIKGYPPGNMDDYEPAWDKVRLSHYLFSESHSVRSPDIRARSELSQSFSQVISLLEKDKLSSDHLSVQTRLTIKQMKKWDAGLYETQKNLFYYLLTSRGCPYKCTFCSEPLQAMHGDANNKFQWNAHSTEWVRNQITRIRDLLCQEGHKMDGIGIWDDMFWVKHRRDPRAFDIIDCLRENNLVYLIEARADQLLRDENWLLRKLAATGCAQVFVGAESASQETLDSVRKGTKVEDYYRLIEFANTYRISMRMSFIVGFPKETDRSINQTLDFCERINVGDFGAWVNCSGPKIFTPYPGTVEYSRAIAAGFLTPETMIEWSGINRSTEEYLRHFPWLEKNCSRATLVRLERYFGKGYKALQTH